MMSIDQDALVKAANQLPPLPNTITELMRLFKNPNYRVENVVKVVELDSSLTGILIRLANASVYGQRVTSSAKTAIMRIGAGMVQAIAFASSVRPDTSIDLSMFKLTLDSYWRHSIFVTAFAEELATQKIAQFSDEFQISAVIHDFGKLVMGKTMTDKHIELMDALGPDLPEFQKELMVMGVNHAEVSAVVCQHWGLPDTIVETVQFHHDPDQISTPDAHGLNLANHLAWRYEGDPQQKYLVEADSWQRSLGYFHISDDKITEIYENGSTRCEGLLDLFSA